MNKEDVHLFLFRTLNKEIDLNEFESWLYEHDEFEQIIGSDLYFDFISTNYREKDSFQIIEKLILKTINIADFEERRICNLLSQLIESEEIAEIAEVIYDEYCKGYTFLRFIALTYISTAGYDESNVYPNRAKLNEFKRKIKIEASRLLRFIEVEEISIQGEYDYVDLRKEKDRIEEHSLEKMYDTNF